jgi:branched-chain amino acid transport system permease protein
MAEKITTISRNTFKEAAMAAALMAVLSLPIALRLNVESTGLTLHQHWRWTIIAVIVVFFGKIAWTFARHKFQKFSWTLPNTLKNFPRVDESRHAALLRVIPVALVLLIAVVIPFTTLGGNMLAGLTMALIYMLLALGLNIVVGYAGLLDLGHAAFYAIGAYTYALLNQHFGLSFWQSLPLAGLSAAMFGAALGFPVLRLRGDYLAIVTLGFGEIVRLLLNNLDTVTGGPDGLTNIDKPTLFGFEITKRANEGGQTLWDALHITYSSTYQQMVLYYIGLALVIVSVVVIARLIRMPMGRAWEALREDEIASRSLALNPTMIKLTAFSLGSMFAGIAGAFYAAFLGSITPDSFSFMESAIILSIVVLGGMGSQRGVLLAALLLTLLPEFARGFAEYRMLIFGLVMVLMMIWRPQGLLPTPRPKTKLPT